MATIEQLPTEVDIFCIHGDAISVARTLGVNLTGDTLAAVVYEDTAAGYAAAIAATPAPAATWSVTVTAAATGAVTLALTANATKSLSLAKAYRWFVRSAAAAKTLESGRLVLRAP